MGEWLRELRCRIFGHRFGPWLKEGDGRVDLCPRCGHMILHNPAMASMALLQRECNRVNAIRRIQAKRVGLDTMHREAAA